MTPHTDILDQPEPLGKSLAGSVALHISVAAAMLMSAWIGRRLPVQWGDINGGGMGSVAVNVVPRIPLPGRSGPINPVANDTESVVPDAAVQSQAPAQGGGAGTERHCHQEPQCQQEGVAGRLGAEQVSRTAAGPSQPGLQHRRDRPWSRPCTG